MNSTAQLTSYPKHHTRLFIPNNPRHKKINSTIFAVPISSSSSSSASKPTGNPLPLPQSPKEIVSQAAAACEKAYADGINLQKIELLLPLIGATDLDDWPGGIQQQFKAAVPLVEQLLKQLKTLPGLEGRLDAALLDDGDAVAAWTGNNLAAIVFPMAETLDEVQKIIDRMNKKNTSIATKKPLVLIINPQWTTEGQVISDFAFPPWKKAAREKLAASFRETYIYKETRMNGDLVRLLCSYPQGWQVNVATSPKDNECVMQSVEYPNYQEIDKLLRSLDWTMSSKGLMDRLQAEVEFNKRSLEQGSGGKRD